MSAAPRLEGLDALRGIAALLVVGLHANAVFGGQPWFAKGYLAVDFFLMLSGFLMVRITEPKLAAGAPVGSWIAARYWRFWPMMALGGLIGLPYLSQRCGGGTDFALAAAANFALLPYPCDRLIFPLNVPAWTIFFELVANAVHVLVLWRMRTVWLAVLALAALGLLFGLSVAQFGSFDIGARPEHLAYTLPRVMFAYLLGMLLGRGAPGQLAVPLPGGVAPLLLPFTLLAWVSGWWNWTFDFAYVALVCPLAIVAALKLERAGRLGWFSAAIAFPLFAIHVPILEGARWLGYGVTVAVPIALAATLVVVAWQHRARWTSRRNLHSDVIET
ncbi:MAG: acyltransferase family protein [Novosphingobium sp.]